MVIVRWKASIFNTYLLCALCHLFLSIFLNIIFILAVNYYYILDSNFNLWYLLGYLLPIIDFPQLLRHKSQRWWMKHHFDANHLSSFKWQLLKNTIKSKWMESNLALLLNKTMWKFPNRKVNGIIFFFKCKYQKLSPFQMNLLLKAMPVNERRIHLVFIEFEGFCNGNDWQSMEQRKAYCFFMRFQVLRWLDATDRELRIQTQYLDFLAWHLGS